MPVQRVSGTIQFNGADVEVKPFSEIQLYMLAEFIRILKDAEVTVEKWYAISSLIGQMVPNLLDEGYVEYDRTLKEGVVNLSAKELDDLYTGLYKLWDEQTKDTPIDIDVESVDSETVAELEAKLKAIKSSNA